jgi:hypothetical protein
MTSPCRTTHGRCGSFALRLRGSMALIVRKPTLGHRRHVPAGDIASRNTPFTGCLIATKLAAGLRSAKSAGIYLSGTNTP